MPVRKPELTAHGKRVTRVAKRIQREKLEKREVFRPQTARRSMSAAQRRKIWLDAGRKCHLCGRRISLLENVQIDHVRPRTIGGEDEVTNYLPICKGCNGIKRNSTPRQIRQALRIGLWALAQIRNGTGIGIEIANMYKKELE